MITCGDCGMELESREIHHHLPDIYLDVWNCRYTMMRSRYMGDGQYLTEVLPFTVPQHWADWILDTCGGRINMSGMYRLPGRIWEWCLAKMRKDEDVARFLEKNINEYLEWKKEGEV